MAGILQLYQESPQAFYAAAAVALSEGAERYGLKSRFAEIIVKYLAQSLIEASGYAPTTGGLEDKVERNSRKEKNNSSKLGGQ